MGNQRDECSSHRGRRSLFSVFSAFRDAGVYIERGFGAAGESGLGKSGHLLPALGGWVAGAVVAFGVGKLARPLLVRLGYQKTLEGYQQFVSKRMKFWQVVLFCIAVPSEIPGYLFGGLHYPFLRFLAAIAIAESIYALCLIVAGDSLVNARPFRLLVTVGIMIVIAAGAGWLLRGLRRRKLRARAN